MRISPSGQFPFAFFLPNNQKKFLRLVALTADNAAGSSHCCGRLDHDLRVDSTIMAKSDVFPDIYNYQMNCSIRLL